MYWFVSSNPMVIPEMIKRDSTVFPGWHRLQLDNIHLMFPGFQLSRVANMNLHYFVQLGNSPCLWYRTVSYCNITYIVCVYIYIIYIYYILYTYIFIICIITHIYIHTILSIFIYSICMFHRFPTYSNHSRPASHWGRWSWPPIACMTLASRHRCRPPWRYPKNAGWFIGTIPKWMMTWGYPLWRNGNHQSMGCSLFQPSNWWFGVRSHDLKAFSWLYNML